MGVYTYQRSRISKKTNKRVTKTYYYYSGKYTDRNTGDRVPYKKRGFESQKEAMKAEREFLLSVATNTTTDMTFTDLCTVYLLYINNRRKGSTIVTVEGHINNHLLSAFGKYSILKLEPKHFVEFQNNKIKEGYSISFINTLMNSARKILYHAVKFYGLSKNPAAMLEALKEPETIDLENEVMVCWDLDMYKKVMKVADDEFYKNIISFLYMTGLRKGEAAALTWNDIDLDNHKLKVTKTLTTKLSKTEREQGQPWKITTPKTSNSIRTISLNQQLVNMLKQMKEESMQYDGWTMSSFVFGLYKPFPYSTLSRRIKAWADIANVPNINPHGLRHSHISFLINNGVNILAVAKRAGDTVDMILNIYAHLFKENEDEIINIMDDKF